MEIPKPSDLAMTGEDVDNPARHAYPAGDYIDVVLRDNTLMRLHQNDPQLYAMVNNPKSHRDVRWTIGFYATKPSSEANTLSSEGED